MALTQRIELYYTVKLDYLQLQTDRFYHIMWQNSLTLCQRFWLKIELCCMVKVDCIRLQTVRIDTITWLTYDP